jgi:phosphoribosylformylglycinamidine cyclo-ligase
VPEVAGPETRKRPAAGSTYAGAGVDLAAGEEAVARIAPAVRSTLRGEVIGGLKGFGGMFALGRYREPVLVATTDGVGTKALLAQATRRLTTIGVDMVAMCVDDLVCQGAEPLFVLDFVSVGRLEPAEMEEIVGGVAEGCRSAGCALLGGEMAEHPDAMAPGEFDIVGFAVGVVERDRIIGPGRVRAGDLLIALASPGLRSNGYSLARKVLLGDAGLDLDGPAWPGADHTLADELLLPSVIYAPAALALLSAVDVHALVHVTGGGIAGNLGRVLPPGHQARVLRGAWSEPRIFSEIARLGRVAREEMERVFNLGVGMIAAVPPEDGEVALATLSSYGHSPVEIGRVAQGPAGVAFT